MSVSQIHQLRKASNLFVNNLDKHIADVVNFNEDLEQLNKDQLKASKLSNDQAITPGLSHSYADWKRKNFPGSYGSGKPNLFLTGDLFDNMDIKVKSDQYVINSTVPYVPSLARKYTENIFGIAPSNQKKAQEITTTLLREKYIQLVLK